MDQPNAVPPLRDARLALPTSRPRCPGFLYEALPEFFFNVTELWTWICHDAWFLDFAAASLLAPSFSRLARRPAVRNF